MLQLRDCHSNTSRTKIDVKFQAGAYENESACHDFILNISNFLFDKLVREKLSRVNFFAILCDGSTDHSITEQEVVYVAYADPDFIQPCLKCLSGAPTSICHFFCLSVHLPICPSICPTVHPSVCPSIRLSIHLSVHSSVHPSIHLSIRPSIHQSIHPSIHQSIRLFVCPSIRLSIHHLIIIFDTHM